MSDPIYEAQAYEIAKMARSISALEAENAKMRKLLKQWYPHMVKRVSKDALSQWGYLQTLREVGIEVE